MTIHRQLLDQARHLVRREPRRPRQASLRRAVSAAYFALFHFLIDRASRQVFGGSRTRRPLRLILGRAFVHGTMYAASRRFAGGTLPAYFEWTSPIPAGVRTTAGVFAKLQEERHRADYDLAHPYSRGEVARLVQLAEDAITGWSAVADDDAARLYLVLLLAWKTLDQR